MISLESRETAIRQYKDRNSIQAVQAVDTVRVVSDDVS